MGKRGRPLGYRLSEESKRAIAEAKTGHRQKQETKDKISRSLTLHFKKFNSLGEEITNKYCRIDDDDLCAWANKVKDDLDDLDDVLTNKTMRNKRRMELTSANHIEYFSHNLTPELIVILKQSIEELGLDVEEILMDL